MVIIRVVIKMFTRRGINIKHYIYKIDDMDRRVKDEKRRKGPDSDKKISLSPKKTNLQLFSK